jgi:hypothetical protein
MPFLFGQPQLFFLEAVHAVPASSKIINAKKIFRFSFSMGYGCVK